MAFNDKDKAIWEKYETVSITEAGYLLYGIEPKSFLYQLACDPDAYPDFYERNCQEDIHELSEQIESAALGGKIEFAWKIITTQGYLDYANTQLNKSSFANWCRGRYKAVHDLLTKLHDRTTRDSIDTSQSKDEEPTTEQSKNNNNCNDRQPSIESLIEKHWEDIEKSCEKISGKNVEKYFRDNKLLKDIGQRTTKTFSNELSKVRRKKRMGV